MRNAEPCVLPVFKTGPHEFAVKHHDLHRLMVETWSPIFCRYQDCAEPSFESFLSEFPTCLPNDFAFTVDAPFQVDDISVQDVQLTIKNLKPSASGVDAWEVEQLKSLGFHSFKNLTFLLNKIEHSRAWPEQILEIPVAAIKKPSGTSPADI